MPEGYVASRFTGLPIPEKYADARPVAVVINNMSQAEIMYEVLAEGDITRLVGIFQAHELSKIGPVRSARDYFVDIAFDYDAVFVHHGGSPSSYERLRTTHIARLDGMALEGAVFWRDRTFPDWFTLNTGTRSLEHSSYTASEPIRNVLEDRGVRTVISHENNFGFAFSVDETGVFRRVDKAETITVPFSRNYTRVFEYNPETALYTVFNRHGHQMDAETGETVTVRNIIIQMVRSHIITGDAEGRRNVQTIGEGSGYLIKDGFYERLRWVKNSHTEPIQWYYLDNVPITLSVGRTWVCMLQDSAEVDFGKETNDE
jgi:hypothetical protein